jgi:hypothetical protein
MRWRMKKMRQLAASATLRRFLERNNWINVMLLQLKLNFFSSHHKAMSIKNKYEKICVWAVNENQTDRSRIKGERENLDSYWYHQLPTIILCTFIYKNRTSLCARLVVSNNNKKIYVWKKCTWARHTQG